MIDFKVVKCFILAAILLMGIGCQDESKEVAPKPAPVEKEPLIKGEKEVLVWIEARANIFGTYGRFHDQEQIKVILDSVKAIGITGLVVDVKGSSGYTNYPSSIATNLTSLEGKSIPEGMDYLAYMIEEGHKRGLKVYASVGVMKEGDTYRGFGKVFDDEKWRKEYQAIVMDATGNRIPISSTGKNAFVNPARPEVQAYEQSIVKEIVSNYQIDGMILDYARYNDINGDFSDFSKNAFIQYLEEEFQDTNAKYMDFPGDIVSSWKDLNGQVVPAVTGKYYKRWLMFRAKTIYNFFKDTKEVVKQIKPDIKFATYVGSWFVNYHYVGVNWASQEYDPFNDSQIRFDWAYPGYNKYGYAEELDFLMTGNYFKYVTLEDHPSATNQYHWWSVEGSLNAGLYVTKGNVPLYGSIDLGNVPWDKKEDIARAIELILKKSQGVMLFDLVHIYAPQYNTLKEPLWEEVAAGIAAGRSE